MEQFLNTETLVIELLLVASLVAIGVRRLRIPYTVALVIAGLLLTLQSPLNLELRPELIMALFVPPLVFEAALQINTRDLVRNLIPILVLAVPGVILTTLLVGGLMSMVVPISLPAALLFGALIAATDPVAVVAIFRELGLPRRLSVLVEGESLFNDGTAIVLFNLMAAVALTGRFNLVASVAEFIRVSAGGVLIGLALGWMISRLIGRVDDYLIETTLTTVLAFGAYLVAERLHFSGVLAVVAAGLVNGNLGPQGMSPTTRIVLFNFWEYVAFLANSLVFLMIGLEVDIPVLLTYWRPVLWAVGGVFLARVVVVYSLGWLASRLTQPVPLRWLHVQTWGGLRGAVSLALALSLPAELGGDRELLRVMAFGVALFTLLGQGTTMRPLVWRLGLVVRSEAQEVYETQHGRMLALRSSVRHLERRVQEGLVSLQTWEILKPELDRLIETSSGAVRATLRSAPKLGAEELDTAWRELLLAQRSALRGLLRDGVISEDVFGKLAADVDAALEQNELPPALAEKIELLSNGGELRE